MTDTQEEDTLPKRFLEKGEYTWLFLHDEAAHIGSGWRYVITVVGRKWAYIHYPQTRSTKKFTVGQYNAIAKGSAKRIERNGTTILT